MNISLKKKKGWVAVFSLVILFILFAGYGTVFAQSTFAEPYELLQPLPLGSGGTEVESVSSLGEYLSGIFKLGIGLAIILAVFMLVLGGLQYMGGEAARTKSAGIKRINSALFGLGLALLAWLFLFTINPNLVEFNLDITIEDLGGLAGLPEAPGFYYADFTDPDVVVYIGPSFTEEVCNAARESAGDAVSDRCFEQPQSETGMWYFKWTMGGLGGIQNMGFFEDEDKCNEATQGVISEGGTIVQPCKVDVGQGASEGSGIWAFTEKRPGGDVVYGPFEGDTAEQDCKDKRSGVILSQSQFSVSVITECGEVSETVVGASATATDEQRAIFDEMESEDEDIRDALFDSEIATASTGGDKVCRFWGDTGCTMVGGLPVDATSSLIDIQQEIGLWLVITGGTETWLHGNKDGTGTNHGLDNAVVDLKTLDGGESNLTPLDAWVLKNTNREGEFNNPELGAFFQPENNEVFSVVLKGKSIMFRYEWEETDHWHVEF